MANGLALALWSTWFLWRRHGVALSSGRFLNRGVQPAMTFWRMVSPREEWQGRGARAGNRGGIARAGTPQAPAAPIEREGKRGEGGREEGAGGT